MKKIGHWIGGELVHKSASRLSPVYNPAVGEVIAETEHADDVLIDQAVQKAHQAFLRWSQVPVIKRVQVLFEFRHLLNQHQDALVQLIISEHGKTHEDALGEIQRGIEVVDFACAMPHLLKGDALQQVGSEVDSMALRQPLGVTVGVTPFNFPAMVPMWMFPIALACGNAFILKPSEKVPSASLLMAKLLKQAGLPDNLFQVIQGNKETVQALIAHTLTQAVSFVGSTAAAQSVYQSASTLGKRVQALGGAKNHAVVLADADIDQAVSGILGAAFGSTGQRCMAISVVVAVGSQVKHALVQKMAQQLPKLKVGGASHVSSQMGPIHDPALLNRILSSIERAEAEGATIVYDGRSHELPTGPGFFVGPTLIEGLDAQMKTYQEELFGPVLGVMQVESYEEALELVNHHPYGNGAVLYTQSGQAARDFTHKVQVGMVGINVPVPVPVPYFSFGGWKKSLFGDMHMYGTEGVRFYTRYKVVTSRWPRQEHSSPVYQMPTSG